jgi:AcrR family transcriptional regulator
VSSPLSARATRRELNPRQAETVERVAVAAREELRAVGFDGLTIRSVASRAEVAPATAYTYFSSKNHLVAEIFWRRLSERPHVELGPGSPVERLTAIFDDLALFLEEEPELAAATTSALLGTDPDVKQLRLLIGGEINSRISGALGPEGSPLVLDALNLAWAGAMLQVGMGHAPVEQMGARLAAVTRLVMGGER